jgi:hypothetical protein
MDSGNSKTPTLLTLTLILPAHFAARELSNYES